MSRDLVDATLAATVRVGTGSGVAVVGKAGRMFVTAAHVVKGARVGVTHRGQQAECDVVATIPESDLAILADRPELAASPLEVSAAATAGQAIALAGFPLGWDEDEALIALGHVGGVRAQAEELWINADSSWGHSGGPVVAIVDGAPTMIGVVLGAAGDANMRLRALRGQLSRGVSGASYLVGQARSARTHRIGGERDFDNPLPLIKQLAGFGEDLAQLLKAARDAIEEHFRTGYVRACAGSEIRRRLGFE